MKEVITKCVIIGAGLAGLGAACQLKELELEDFHVLEVRSRIGGRVDSITFRGQRLATGPAFIHGVNGNPIYTLSKAANVSVLTDATGEELHDSQLVIRSTSGGADVSKEFYAATSRYIEAKSKLSWDGGADFATSMKAAGWNPTSSVERCAEYEKVDFSIGSPAHNVSTMAELLAFNFHESDGGLRVCTVEHGEGFVRIVNHLAVCAGLLQKDDKPCTRLHLNTQVTNIETELASGKEYFRVYSGSGGDRCCWITQYVIVTVPPTLLSSTTPLIQFSPPLPKEFANAMTAMSMTDYTRVFIAYDHVFWDDADFLYRVVDTDDNISWYENDLHPARELIFFQDIFYRKRTSKNDCAILVCHVSGEVAHHLSELSNAELAAKVGQSLASIYPQHADVASKPLEVKLVTWRLDQFAGGSYAYVNPHMTPELATFFKNDFLRVSYGEKVLYFAGDGYTISLVGYAQGALLSGRKVASDIIKNMTI